MTVPLNAVRLEIDKDIRFAWGMQSSGSAEKQAYWRGVLAGLESALKCVTNVERKAAGAK